MRHWIWYGHVVFCCNNLMNCRLDPHFVCSGRKYMSVSDDITILINFAWTLTSVGISICHRKTSMCSLSASAGKTQKTGDSSSKQMVCEHIWANVIAPVSHCCVPELKAVTHRLKILYMCEHAQAGNCLCICNLELECDFSAAASFVLLFLTILTRLFHFLYVWRHKHGTQLLRGVNDHLAEGIQTVHQANVDSRQRNISGLFLPLWVLLQKKCMASQAKENEDCCSL